ncbi:MAG: TIR domain-containing protein, partial [Pseudanabaenales cyanobacterium]|nr:TIR domain-containing protein [Pseudanabaenales cyanobacterium]
MVDVFISYSRKDQEFVHTLHQALSQSSYDSWVDWEDIPPTAAWWKEVQAGIESAHTCIFVISPDSVVSNVCRQEIDHAAKHNKRLIPIVRRDEFEQQQVHPALSKLNWLFFRESDSFESAFSSLIKAIDTDLDHVRNHTRLLVRAIEWSDQGWNNHLLLRGSILEEAEQWLTQSVGKAPSPTNLQAEYVTISRKAANTRQRITVGVLSLLLLLSVGLGGLAFIQFIRAERAATVAKLREQAAVVLNWLPTAKAAEGLVLAIETLDRSRTSAPAAFNAAQSSLLSAIEIAREQNRFQGHESGVLSVAFSPDGQSIVSGDEDGVMRLWSLKGGAIGQPFQGHEEGVSAVAFCPDGGCIVSGGWDGAVRLWDLEGDPIGQPFTGHIGVIASVDFSPDGQRIVSGGWDGAVRLWDLEGEPIGQPFQGPEEGVSAVAFSPDGQRIVSGGGDGAVQLWGLDGDPIGQPFQGPEKEVSAVAFSP